MIVAKPFLKWVGGKRSILHERVPRVPAKYTTYHEPFLGGGALFFALRPGGAYLTDINYPLTITYNEVRDNVEPLIDLLRTHRDRHSKEYYLAARQAIYNETNPTKIAAWFIYLNKTCFNGLYRVNKSGKFNVPMGSYKNPNILDEKVLRAASDALTVAVILQGSYVWEPPPEEGAFYYMDPPYHTTYNQYDRGGFTEDDHRRLADICRGIDKAGGYFMVSNSDTPLIRDLYKSYNIEVVSASRSVAAKAEDRGKENELIIRNYV